MEKKSLIQEFKDFIMKGNVMDLAVGVVIGGAFSAIVTSLVNDVIGPVIGMICGGIDFSGLAIPVGDANLMIGNFIQAVINFLIVSLVIFSVVKAFNKAKGFIRSRIGHEMKLRHVPELIFKVDHSMEYSRHIEDIIRTL